MPSTERDRYVLAAIGIASLLVMLYSVLVVQQLLLGFLFVLGTLGLYLVWRFLRVLERIADALETREGDA